MDEEKVIMKDAYAADKVFVSTMNQWNLNIGQRR